ncbi:MAG: hypothetical protein IPN69_08690 [Acidobacteria bacterium]|nr:hypothetical protein [Acidobacteriota bacterium]
MPSATCPLVGWFPPIFSKPMPIVIPPGQTETVEVENRYGCLAGSSQNTMGESLLDVGM